MKKLHDVALTGNQHFFPPYHRIVILREDVARRWHLNRVLAPLFGRMTTADQTALNYDVVVRGESPAAVAHRFLVHHHPLK
jgi:glycine betaine/choline ABC-type transport system substrate-binding protein